MQFNKDQKDKFFQWQPLLFAIILVLGILIGKMLSTQTEQIIFKNQIVEPKGKMDRVSEVLKYIDAQYVDTVNTDHLTEVAIESIMEELDPHSYYITRSDIKDLNEKTKGDFEGIGIEFLIVEDTISIIKTIENGPSEKAGLQSGDQIIEANGIDLTDSLSLDSIRNIIKGPTGSVVDVKVNRKLADTVLSLSLKRAKIPYHSVLHSFMLDSNTTYIKLAHFNGNSYREFMEAIEEHVEDNTIEKLVIDLRDNPGGYLQEVVKILSQLFNEKGKMLVYTKGRGAQNIEYKSSGHNFFTIDKVAVFINENSASASEILAGAIQDWERGIVLGRRSFGKGLVQEQFELSDGSAIRLTTAKYHTPTGRLIQRPYGNGDYKNFLDKRLESGEFFALDSIKTIDSLTYQTKQGNILYAGKGIIPDIFVPRDSVEFNPFIQESFKHLSAFVYKKVQNDRIKGQLPDNPQQWWQEFDLNDEIWNDWLSNLEDQDVDTELEVAELMDIRSKFEETYRFYYIYYTFSIAEAIELEMREDKYWKALQPHWYMEGKFTNAK